MFINKHTFKLFGQTSVWCPSRLCPRTAIVLTLRNVTDCTKLNLCDRLDEVNRLQNNKQVQRATENERLYVIKVVSIYFDLVCAHK